MIKNLFINKKQRLYVFGVDACYWCNKAFTDQITVIHYFNKDRRFGEKVFCVPCLEKVDDAYKQFGQAEWREAIYCSYPPRNVIAIVSPVEIVYSKTVAEATLEHQEGVRIIDRTVWAGRDLQLDGSEYIGKSVEELESAYKEQSRLIQ